MFELSWARPKEISVFLIYMEPGIGLERPIAFMCPEEADFSEWTHDTDSSL